MTQAIEDILAKAKPPETTVRLAMRGDLVAEYERLNAQLAEASTVAPSLGEVSPARAIAEQMAAIHDDMYASQVDYKLRAMRPRLWSDFFITQPERPAKVEGEIPEEAANEFREAWHAFMCRLVAGTCYEPAMTAEQADALSECLSNQQWSTLTDDAWGINTGRQSIPFSVAASALLQPTEQKPKRPTTTGSRARRSSAKSR